MKPNRPATDYWREAGYVTRYAGSGMLNTIVGFAVIFSAMAVGMSPIISNILGYGVGFLLGFVLSKKFVFRSNGHFVSESVFYLAAFFVSFFFNLLVLYISLSYLGLHPIPSQALAASSYTVLMYILTRFFVFSPGRGRGRGA